MTCQCMTQAAFGGVSEAGRGNGSEAGRGDGGEGMVAPTVHIHFGSGT
jgi:hypothetical protein